MKTEEAEKTLKKTRNIFDVYYCVIFLFVSSISLSALVMIKPDEEPYFFVLSSLVSLAFVVWFIVRVSIRSVLNENK